MTKAGRGFRFAITGRGGTLAEWRDFARKAEDLGYSTLAVGEHIDRFFEPFVALSAAADATKQIRLGTHIAIGDFRHPVMLAKEAATVDVLTDGRLELGIGTGSTIRDFQMGGLSAGSAPARVDRLAEVVAILRAFFTQETFSFKGTYFHIDGLRCYPRPVQRPHIPLMIGAASKRMLRFAAREADIISLISNRSGGPAIWGPMSEKLEVVREAAGARLDGCELHTWYTWVQVDGEPALPGLTPSQPDAGLIGSREQVIEQLIEDRERDGLSYITVTGAAIDAFAPVVARLVNT